MLRTRPIQPRFLGKGDAIHWPHRLMMWQRRWAETPSLQLDLSLAFSRELLAPEPPHPDTTMAAVVEATCVPTRINREPLAPTVAP